MTDADRGVFEGEWEKADYFYPQNIPGVSLRALTADWASTKIATQKTVERIVSRVLEEHDKRIAERVSKRRQGAETAWRTQRTEEDWGEMRACDWFLSLFYQTKEERQ